MDLGADRESALWRELELLDHVGHGNEAFVDRNVGALRILRVPLVRIGIPTKHELETVPLDDEAHRSIEGVDGRNGTNRDAVLLIDDCVHFRVVELGDIEMISPWIGEALAAVEVPGERLA